MSVVAKKKILVVDDEREVREAIRDALPEDGYVLAEAEGAKRALEIAGQLTLDLLVTDAMLPNMKGRDLANRIATLQPALKVLYISGYSSETLINHGIFPIGAYSIGKPIAGPVLARKVRDILDQGRPWKEIAGGQ